MVFRCFPFQVQKELKQLLGRDHQLLHLYINIQQDMYINQDLNELLLAEDEEEEEGEGEGGEDIGGWRRIRSCLCCCLCLCCCRRRARMVNSYIGMYVCMVYYAKGGWSDHPRPQQDHLFIKVTWSCSSTVKRTTL